MGRVECVKEAVSGMRGLCKRGSEWGRVKETVSVVCKRGSEWDELDV